jgi:L-galactose dehydrogenase
MKYRTLGKTGLTVSILGFGGSSLGSVFRTIDEQDGIRAVHVAIDNGINLIDTAPFYGLTRGETVLGKALRDIPREKYVLATKVGRYGSEFSEFDFSGTRVTRSVDASLSRLGVEYIDIIQVHDMEFGNIDTIVYETIPALRKIQSAGKARYVGVTGLPMKLFRYVLERTEVDTVQSYCHFCLNDASLTDAIPFFQSKNVGLVNSAPLAMRLLSLDGPPAWHPAPAVLKAKCKEAALFCHKQGSDIARLALQFAVANPDVHATMLGTANSQRVLDNIRQIDEPLDHDLLNEVLNILRPVHNTTWMSGHPENN